MSQPNHEQIAKRGQMILFRDLLISVSKAYLLSEKNAYTGSSAEDQLKNGLAEIILNKKNTMNRVASSELVTLFWKIGDHLNGFLKKGTGIQKKASVITSISSDLVTHYGPYFTEKNIKQMQRFADLFPDLSSPQEYIYLLSWEHIQRLLPIKDAAARHFFLTLKIEQGLHVKDLRKAISANLFVPALNKSLPSVQMPRLSMELLSKNDQTRPNLFKEPLLSSFRALVQLPALSNNHSMGQSSLSAKLHEQIDKYRDQQNRGLNANLNLLFWEIGERINKEILSSKKGLRRRSVIDHAASLLKHGKPFTADQLEAMTRFAERFPAVNTGPIIAYTLSWEQILPLLEVEDARLQTLLPPMPEAVIKTTTKRTGNSIVSIKTVDYDWQGEKTKIAGIFENAYFLDLMGHKKGSQT